MNSNTNLDDQRNTRELVLEVQPDKSVMNLVLTIAEAAELVLWNQKYSYFTQSQKTNVPEEISVTSGRGSNSLLLYQCHYGKNPKGWPQPINSTCTAKILLNFSGNYQENPLECKNEQDRSKKSVKMTWHWQHNHDPDRIISRKTKDDIYSMICNGFSWREAERELKMKHMLDHRPEEAISIQHFHYIDIKKKVLKNVGVKNKCIETSLKLWAKRIQGKGLAEFKDESSFLKELPGEKEFKTDQGLKVWSFTLISNWQRTLLKKEGKSIYLSSTCLTCGGLDKKENVFLFTIYVNNRITREGCPAAFLITNSQDYRVIAEFLKTVNTFSHVEPTRVAIDCEDSEKRALEIAWPRIKVVKCRWHIARAFRKNWPSKVLTEIASQDLSKRQTQAKKDFDTILEHITKSESEIALKTFFQKYNEYPQLISHVEDYWLETLKNSITKNNVPLAINNIFIEHFLFKLRGRYLMSRRKSRPDVLVYELFIHVLRAYQRNQSLAWEKCVPRSNDLVEKRALAKADKISDADINDMLTPGSLEFNVDSFTRKTMNYDVIFESALCKKAKCTCKEWRENLSWCKHIFLVLRWKKDWGYL